ncbi:unnamed protein product [Blepharisma stoltei]|uniref:C2 domain-containing protein n=1 Tax=Blepharisma stoltei TaxID=1481888 RepID=A0AAU9K9W3_9CILI|nr:unnamed protein product [Blepharisma stoltei]
MLKLKRSSSSANTYDENIPNTRLPYLVLKIESGIRLGELVDTMSLQPYIVIESGNRSWQTQIGSPSDDSYEWGEIFEIEVEDLQPFMIHLYDKDEYGSDDILASLIFSRSLFESWRSGNANMWLKLSPPRVSIDNPTPLDIAVEVRANQIYNSYDCGPMLHIQASFMDAQTLKKMKVLVKNHKIKAGANPYIYYEVSVVRNDGVEWKIELRYSQVYALRRELISIIPGLRKLPFPRKTYFDWLYFLCSSCNRFSPSIIAERQKGMEFFLNAVLENCAEIESETLNNLLKLPKD